MLHLFYQILAYRSASEPVEEGLDEKDRLSSSSIKAKSLAVGFPKRTTSFSMDQDHFSLTLLLPLSGRLTLPFGLALSNQEINGIVWA
uniref:Uncharacterized protein n=1 Tax=Utricularia reniformis TaxID=192314 RepID=A0A1Y0B1H5_9LAMI|nr:hypothetical protein AEK19_MT0984 [Utricularia reniformis]ART31209.1 hypothetical protein AEK19_MT0984 [Utricularia reniformis]